MSTCFYSISPFLLCCFLFFQSGALYGQSPYEISLKRDIPLLSIGIGGRIAGLVIKNNTAPLTASAVAMLRPEDVNDFDRDAIFNNSKTADHLSDVLIYTANVTPLLYLSNRKTRKGMLEISVIGLEVLFLNSAATTLTKTLVKRTRPTVYNPLTDTDLSSISQTRLSFFSGHTSGTTAMFFFSAKVFSDHFPDSRYKPLVWSAGALIPAVAAYTRVKSGKHFPTDVVTGYTVGALFGFLVPHFHKKKTKDKNQRVGFSLYPTSGGLGLMMEW